MMQDIKFPKIICWNLRNSTTNTMTVTKDEKGYVMLSGFSSELLNCLLNAEDFNTNKMMKKILDSYIIPYDIINSTINLSNIEY